MASSDRSAVELLTPADLPDCLALSTQVHWNQVEADWRIFFDQGLVWGIRQGGSVVASAALLPYPPKTAWISMVLTAERARGRGFASRLATATMNESARRGLLPQLDATTEGEPIYSQLGFRTVARLTRWRRKSPAEPSPLALASAMSEPEFKEICRLDARAIGFARPSLLRSLLERGPAAAPETAFCLSRDGRTAHQIGPVVAPSQETAEAVLSTLLQRLGDERSVIIDASDEARGLAGFLEARGFGPERQFLRMAHGSAPRPDFTTYLAAAGPELG